MPGCKCDKCMHIFGKNEDFYRRGTEVNWFRGDDEVECLCGVCYAKEHP